jgi:hypothetical protein
LYNSGWWEGLGARRIAGVQLFVDEVICPPGVFRQALDESLGRTGRTVYTHELGLARDDLIAEFLGDQEPPTLEEILALVPKPIIFMGDPTQGGQTSTSPLNLAPKDEEMVVLVGGVDCIIKHGAGNIQNEDAADYTLTPSDPRRRYRFDSTAWREIGPGEESKSPALG